MAQQQRWTLGGGLASGKSAVRELLAQSGVLTIDADRIGHEVLAPDGPAYEEVAARWPETVDGGEINRGRLAGIVFSDPAELKVLESITHPHIFDRIRSMVEGFNGPAVVEIPLLEFDLGGGWGRIVVDCRDDVKLDRAIARGMSKEDAAARIRNQPSRGEWLGMADVVIPNHGSMELLADSVARLAGRL